MSKFAKLGQLLKRRRIEKNITQIDLAKHLGYSSAQFVSNWERGQCNPAFDTLPAIADILSISKKEIIEIIVNETRLELEANFKTKPARKKAR